jgi:RNA polymerase sigma-70 factor, ECF subfamily
MAGWPAQKLKHSLSTSAGFRGDNRLLRKGSQGGRGRAMLTQAELVGLLAAIAKQDVAAFERLYEATRAKLYGVLLRILGRPELAEEVMQETYLKVWRMAGKFDPTIATPITWMVALARNRAIDIVRKKGEISIEDAPQALEIAADTPTPLARREMTEELRRLLSCLGKLDPEKQRILLLAYYSGWSRDQLAKKLDIPVNTIKTWLRRSLLEIRGCMGA